MEWVGDFRGKKLSRLDDHSFILEIVVRTEYCTEHELSLEILQIGGRQTKTNKHKM